MSDSVLGAMKEAQAMSRGTKCRQYLFSLSLSPPESEAVAVEVFEKALDAIEQRLGLEGQPRIVVFHEKEGRRHAHAVWSRIDIGTMTARPLSFFKRGLQEVSRQLFLENGWKMPLGLVSKGNGDPRNFNLDEWQKAKRQGSDPKLVKELAQQCWAASDNRASFERALEERGLYLARGDRRGRVIVTADGDVHSLSRLLSGKARDLTAKLGEPESLPSIAEALIRIRAEVVPRLAELIAIARRNSRAALQPLLDKRSSMAAQHRAERETLHRGQAERWKQETTARASRLRSGLGGVWDRLTGERSRLVKMNEVEAFFAVQRDAAQRHAIVKAQLAERKRLQEQIQQKRRDGAVLVLALYRDAARMRSRELSPDRESLTARFNERRGENSRRATMKPHDPSLG